MYAPYERHFIIMGPYSRDGTFVRRAYTTTDIPGMQKNTNGLRYISYFGKFVSTYVNCHQGNLAESTILFFKIPMYDTRYVWKNNATTR